MPARRREPTAAATRALAAAPTLAAALAVVVAALAPAPAAAQSVRDPALEVRRIASGLGNLTTMAFIGPADFLVLQRLDGRVRRVTGGTAQVDAVLDLGVDRASERGLLGIAVHPAFPAPPHVFLYVTESSTGGDTDGAPAPIANRVYRYTWDGARLVSPLLILDLPVVPGPNHDAGVLAFGPDGKLYVVIGDLNRRGQLQNLPGGPAPDDTGVILRINPDGSTPPDNPFAALGGPVARYFAYGIRNSFGLAFDPVTGRLWDTENGPDQYDEVNLVGPGFNSGWTPLMGPDERDPQSAADLFVLPGSAYSDPEFSWREVVAPTGLAFLASTRLGAQYLNQLFVADFIGGRIHRFALDASRTRLVPPIAGLADLVADTPAERDATVFAEGFAGITDLKVGPDGLLYVVTLDGAIHVVGPALSAFVTAFYTTALGRAPSAGELSAWVDFLAADRGPARVAAMARAFFGGGEYLARPLTPALHTSRLFLALLGRSPGPGELAAFGADIAARLDGPVASFVSAPEFQARLAAEGPAALVARLYAELLGRSATGAEVGAWAGYLTATGDALGVALGFFASAEYLNTSRPLAAHVGLLYRGLLGRDPTPAESSAWTAYVATQIAPALEVVVASAEFRSRFSALGP
jgi:glucose/arabinose dehydrogenase